MKKLKTLVAIGLVLSMVFSTVAFASDQSSTDVAAAETVRSGDAETDGDNSIRPCRTVIVGSKGGTISGGYGEVELFLGKDVSYGTIKASVAFSSTSGVVSCSVKYPNGGTQQLGAISITTGAVTVPVPGYYLEAGTYTFRFDASTTDSFDVLCTIYE